MSSQKYWVISGVQQPESRLTRSSASMYMYEPTDNLVLPQPVEEGLRVGGMRRRRARRPAGVRAPRRDRGLHARDWPAGGCT